MLEITTPVEHIVDGDTLIVPWDAATVAQVGQTFGRDVERDRTRGLSVRLFGLDAPEMGQDPWGQRVKERLQTLLKPYDAVVLQVRDLDPYSRLVSEVWVGGDSVNVQLIAEGYCVAYFRWLRGTNRWQSFANAHDRAKANQIGIWGDRDFISPGEWRQHNRQEPSTRPDGGGDIIE